MYFIYACVYIFMYVLIYKNTFLMLCGASASLNISRNFAVMSFPTRSLNDYVSR